MKKEARQAKADCGKYQAVDKTLLRRFGRSLLAFDGCRVGMLSPGKHIKSFRSIAAVSTNTTLESTGYFRHTWFYGPNMSWGRILLVPKTFTQTLSTVFINMCISMYNLIITLIKKEE